MSVQTPPAADVSAERERASFGKLFLPEYFWTTVSALAGLTIVALGNYVLTTAMPRVLTDLGDPVLYAWATSAYMLSQVVGTKLDGIVGYNFLRNYKVVIDYPNEVLGLI